jgi:hypothetical protein
VFEYLHTGGRCSLTGGYVVRHAGLPTLAGRYVYGDYCTGEIRSVVLAKPSASDDRAEGLTVPQLSSFGEDACGHLYATSLGGQVHRIDDAPLTPCPDPPPGGGGPGGGPGGEPGAGETSGDGRPPELSVDRARRQRMVANRFVFLGIRCNEACGLTTGGSISVRGAESTKRYSLSDASRSLPARTRVRLAVKLSTKTRAKLARRMAAGAKPLARVVITARDAAGNQVSRAVHVRAIG